MLWLDKLLVSRSGNLGGYALLSNAVNIRTPRTSQ
jgi:hypothetical protein